jgi:hypothetical protein
MAERDNVILAHLLHIRAAIDDVRNDAREMMQPIGSLESRHANMSDRLDLIEARIERIEHRLDLTDV